MCNVKFFAVATVLGCAFAAPAFAQDAVSTVSLNFKTGGDNLRGGALVSAQILAPGGRSFPAVVLNRGAWEGGSTNSVAFNLPSRMTVEQIQRLSIRLIFDGAGRNFGETYDNWNVDTFSVTTPRICTGGENVARLAPTRMTGASRVVRFDMTRLTTAAGSTPVSQLNFSLRTGRDDLRSGALATATIRRPGGRSYPPIALNSGRVWGGGSTNNVTLNLPEPLSPNQIESISIDFDGAGRNFGETYDNWDIQSATIALPQTCTARTFKQHSGTPWWRATGESREQIVSLAP